MKETGEYTYYTIEEVQLFGKQVAVVVDWVIGIVIAVGVSAVIIKKNRDKKAGKSSCGCSCGGCSSCKDGQATAGSVKKTGA